ncbi:hypothetical protein AXE65_08265 [Ventosimonas gracilis]|uniref:Transglutaminase-like domain-containing protein n=1 Tax=Ventosimonas gracilis TaxID=1680762 RepID=A0A139SXY0_9GAMM|nr:DUF3488 and transglutaminase-like domain-containing protein [Ventosimonas gracilis]KXU39488.1 hypothetical protein AXE65_08265 [Ventosimonas gracilis]
MKSQIDDSLSRSGLFWLLFAQALVIAPHGSHIPLWTLFLWLGCACWRIQIYRMRARLPGRTLRLALVVLIGFSVYLSRDTLIGLNAAALLLVATFFIKLLELNSRRDAQVLILLGFFVLVTAWLFEDGLLFTLYSLLPLLALLAALCGLQHPRFSAKPWQALKLCSLMLAQALPLMLLLFVFFPRFSPLWVLPMAGGKGLTGLSNSMDVSDIAELALSDELVFRARFNDGLPPPQPLLYWRALTLDNFDGKRWSQSRFAASSRQVPPWQPKGSRIDYQMTLQPSYQNWLPMLELGQIHLPQLRQTADFRVEYPNLIDRPLHYRASSWPYAERHADNERALDISRRLPKDGNPRSRALAEALRKTHASDTEALVNDLLARFKQAPYRYTLTPEALSKDSIDSFLFDTQNGFCAHYAGASVFVLRAAGIAARMVSGYQGGEWNEVAGFLQVRQYDAHAWVEYWHEQKGWRRIDPTFAVAPERIERGLEAALAGETLPQGSGIAASQRYRSIAWLNQLRLLAEDLQYDWQLWVLGYRNEQRLELLSRLDRTALLAIGGAFALFLAMLVLALFKPWQGRKNTCQRAFIRFEQLLAAQGVKRAQGEAPRHFATRAAAALPAAARPIADFIDTYEAHQYAAKPLNTARLKRSLKTLRGALAGVRRKVKVQPLPALNRN